MLCSSHLWSAKLCRWQREHYRTAKHSNIQPPKLTWNWEPTTLSLCNIISTPHTHTYTVSRCSIEPTTWFLTSNKHAYACHGGREEYIAIAWESGCVYVTCVYRGQEIPKRVFVHLILIRIPINAKHTHPIGFTRSLSLTFQYATQA